MVVVVVDMGYYRLRMYLHYYSMYPSADNDAVVAADDDEYVVVVVVVAADDAAVVVVVDDDADCTFYQKCIPQ